MERKIERNEKIGNDSLHIEVEESKHLSLTSADIKNTLVKMDNIFLPNGQAFIVTNIDENGNVELMMKGRLTVEKDQLPHFLTNALIVRAECFCEE